MANILPPPPIGEPPGSFAWQQWYVSLQQLYTGTGTVPWALIDTAGSDIQDIAARAHNNLQSIQGGTTGTFFHLKSAIKSSKVHDFGSIAAGVTATTTQTVTGAGTDDVVLITPNSQLEDGLVIYGFVNAVDTVTIVAQNTIGAAIDPASRTYYILVMDN